jgi:AraC-like DNA-binding protein
MAQTRAREGDVAVRLAWPFVRVVGIDAASAALFAREGYDASVFVAAEGRLPLRLALDVLAAYVARTGDETVGLRAGAAIELEDLGLVGAAARCCATVGAALRLVTRYGSLLGGAAQVSMTDAGEEVLFGVQIADGAPRPAAANDFVLAGMLSLARRWSASAEPPLELHLAHPRPHYAAVYPAMLEAPLRFGMPQNGFVVPRKWLALPMPHPQPDVLDVVERQLRPRLEEVSTGTRDRVAAIVRSRLPRGRLSMRSVAREMSLSVSTLGRRLGDEGVRYGAIVDETRRELAEALLRRRHRSVGEIAVLLGFAHTSAFHSAVRRWTGMSPSEYRARLLALESALDTEPARERESAGAL